MALTDTFVRQVKHSGKAAGDKYTDSGGMYLLVKAAGKYWRMDYTHAAKRKTLSLGVYPEVTLAKARKRRGDARELLAEGLDPAQAFAGQPAATGDTAAGWTAAPMPLMLSSSTRNGIEPQATLADAWRYLVSLLPTSVRVL